VVSAEWAAGLAAYDRGEWEVAAREFEEVVRSSRTYAGGHYMLGLSLARLGRTDRALDSLRRAAGLDDGNVPFRLALCQALDDSGQSRQAYALLRPLQVRDVPLEERVAFALLFARVATRNDRAAEAESVLLEVIEWAPGSARLYHAVGVARDRQGDHRGAFAAFRRAFELDRELMVCGRSAIRAALALRRAEPGHEDASAMVRQAATVAERLAEVAPTFEHQVLAGEVWMEVESWPRALRWFDAAHGRQPRNALVRYYRGTCRYAQDDLEGALVELQAALAIGTRGRLRLQVYERLGWVYADLQDFNRAASAFLECGNRSLSDRMSELADRELASAATGASP
jgi:tetratricopeptide (TPR) repeat protein